MDGYQLVCTAKTACIRINEGELANTGPVPKAWAFCLLIFPIAGLEARIPPAE